MATEAKLRQLADKGCPVYYFYSSERYLVRQAVAAAVRVLSADSDEDATILDGAAPELEQLIMAAGTISFFGTRRVVVLPEIDPAAYGSKDLDELCSTLSSLENAVAVLGSVFPLERGKIKLGKQAQKLQAQCKAIGYTEELAKSDDGARKGAGRNPAGRRSHRIAGALRRGPLSAGKRGG